MKIYAYELCPTSPRYLYRQGKRSTAILSLEFMWIVSVTRPTAFCVTPMN